MEIVTNGMKNVFGYVTKQWTRWIGFILGKMLSKKKRAPLKEEACSPK